MPEQNSDLSATISKLWAMVVRRRWWFLFTTCLVSIAVIRISFLIPDQFRSEATIFISNPRVPQEYIVPNNTASAMEAVDSMRREILSRTRLAQLIDQFDLYPHQRKMGPAALTELMRTHIEVEPISKDPERRPMNAFLIAFTYHDPQKAQQVANSLTALVIQENLQAQEQSDTGTTTFLQQQLESAQAQLQEQEKIVQSYKMRNIGELPEQSAGNMELLSGLQLQLETAGANLEHARQQRTYLKSMLDQLPPSSAMAPAGAPPAVPGSLNAEREELVRLRKERDDLLARYSPAYPDVLNLNQRIADQEARVQHLVAAAKSEAASKGNIDVPASPPDPAAIQLKSQLEANAIEIEDAQKRVAQLESQADAYRRRIAVAPLRQQQLENVLRNYEGTKQNYTNLLNKKTQSELATKLALRQRHEQFQVIDPASLPLRPSSPNRQSIALFGLVGGLVAGLLVSFLADSRDHSFRTESDVRHTIPVALVIGVPPLLTAQEREERARKRTLEWAMGCVIALLLASAQFYVYFTS